jgi:hypothetical protein
MIGPAEIEEIVSDYAEALKKEGCNVPTEGLTWPLSCTKPSEPTSPTVWLRPVFPSLVSWCERFRG